MTTPNAGDGARVISEGFPVLAEEMINLHHLELRIPCLHGAPLLNAVRDSKTKLSVLKFLCNPTPSTITALADVLDTNRLSLMKFALMGCDLNDDHLRKILRTYFSSRSKPAAILRSATFEGKYTDASVEAILRILLRNLSSLTIELDAIVACENYQALEDKFGNKLKAFGSFFDSHDPSEIALANEAALLSAMRIADDDDEDEAGSFTESQNMD